MASPLPPAATAARYWDETARGIANVLVHTKDAWYGDRGVYYSREKERLEKYLKPLQYGVAATAFLFVNFRVTGSHRFKAWRSRWAARSADRPAPTTQQQQQQQQQAYRPGYLETKRDRDVRQALASMRTLTDFLVSLSVGTSGALFLLHGHAGSMRKDFEEAPLVAGRSLVADHMCGPMVAVADDEPPPHQQGVATDPSLASFAAFVSHCRSRRRLEERLRNEPGMPSDAPVVVPYPGVPRPPTGTR